MISPEAFVDDLLDGRLVSPEKYVDMVEKVSRRDREAVGLYRAELPTLTEIEDRCPDTERVPENIILGED